MMHRPLLLCLLYCTAAAFAPFPQRPPPLLKSSRNPVPPEIKPTHRRASIRRSCPTRRRRPVSRRFEVTFVNACMQLATGYVDTLKLFIAAALTAYERGFTVNALSLELAQCPTQTAGRPLMQEEVELRSVWLSLVYLTLANVRHESEASESVGASVPAEIRSKFQTCVRRRERGAGRLHARVAQAGGHAAAPGHRFG